MAKTLSKTGIATDSIVKAAHTVSGSLTLTGSLKVDGIISNTTTITAGGTITGTNVQSLGTLTADGNLTTLANSTLGNAIGDTTTISGNITGSGNITLASFVSGSTIIGKKNSLAQNNSGGTVDTTMTTNSFPPCSVIGVTQTTSNNAIGFTLPAAEAGLHYTFIATVTSTGTSPTIFQAPSAILNGIAICDDGTEDIAGTNFVIAATKFIKGTRIYCLSDGNIWHITAFCLCDVGDVSTS